ncbi:hypothetical protein [Risungbinella massiliensis]|uniref:hypothetical protein n=1 Tax=Risungbinella massiliensis TaxID=1329796 RepID=UPI0005CC19EE|nr:hypothetical protein [Risungbinella massiliensis]
MVLTLKRAGWILLLSFVLLVVGCAPEGMNQSFYDQAIPVFQEIDDDILEQERSDRDDLLNLELLRDEAQTKKEKLVVEMIQDLVNMQEPISRGDQTIISQYLDLREDIEDVLEYDLPPAQFLDNNLN